MHTLDLTGLNCPHVVLRLAEQMRGLSTGSRLRVIATDPMSAIDIPFYLDRTGNRLISRGREEGRIILVVERGDG